MGHTTHSHGLLLHIWTAVNFNTQPRLYAWLHGSTENLHSLFCAEPSNFPRESASTGWRASWLRVGHALPSAAHTLMQLQIEPFVSFYPTHFSLVELSKEKTCSWSQSCAGCCRRSGRQHHPTPVSSTRGLPGISKMLKYKPLGDASFEKREHI